MALGIAAGLSIIVFLEITRHLRMIKRNNDEIVELKRKIAQLEDSLHQ